ncbi:hypothetical protein, partial [Scytonema sp. UIC 10036]|uniref:hypothetical protein n=1 Tax=Scytonema sp. UIC 10036 TaxID=2304196 RepID=UPI001A9A9BE8
WVEERNPTFISICWVTLVLNPTYNFLIRAVLQPNLLFPKTYVVLQPYLHVYTSNRIATEDKC